MLVSIIIPTYNDRNLLDLTLHSINALNYPKYRLQIIVVDDGSSENNQFIIEKYKAHFSLEYYFQEDLGFRAASARNLGLMHAKGELTLFVDAGVLLDKKAVHEHVHAYQKNIVNIGLSYGFNEFTTQHAEQLCRLTQQLKTKAFDFTHFINELKQYSDCRIPWLESIDFDLSRCRHPYLIFWTCHVAVPTHLLKQVAGFDESFTSWGGEDVDLSYRLYQQGCQFQIVQQAYSLHYPQNKNENNRKISANKNCDYLAEKHNNDIFTKHKTMGWEALI